MFHTISAIVFSMLLFQNYTFSNTLNKKDLFNLLAGQFSLYRAQPKAALTYFKQPTKQFNSHYLTKKTTQLALAEKDYETMLMAAKKWVLLKDTGTAHFYLSLAFAYNQAPIHAFKHMQKAEKKNHPTDFTRLTKISKPYLLSQKYYLKELTANYAGQSQNYDALVAIAFLLIDQGKLKKPAEFAEKALLAGQENPATFAFVSKIYQQLNQPKKALQVFQHGVSKHPNHHNLRYKFANFALIYDINIAKNQFEILNLYYPKDQNVQLKLAEAYRSNQAYEQATSLLERLLKNNFKPKIVLIQLAQIAQIQGHLEKALNYRLEAYKQDEDQKNMIQIIQLQQLLGNWKTALSLVNKSLKLASKSNEKIKLQDLKIRILDKVGKYKQALKLSKYFLKANPTNQSLLITHTLLIAKHQSIEEFVNHIYNSIASLPNNLVILQGFGQALANSDLSREKQSTLLKHTTSLDPYNAELLDSFGNLLYRIGDERNAINYLLRAYDTSPKVETAINLGKILWHSGDKIGAKQIFNQAKKLTPHDKKLQLTMDQLKVSGLNP